MWPDALAGWWPDALAGWYRADVSTLIVCAVVVAAGFVNGLLGFGAGIIAMLVLSATHGLVHAASLVNILSVVLTSYMAFALRSYIDKAAVKLVLPAGLLGVAAGVFLLDSLPEQLMTRTLGAVVILFAAWNLRPQAKPSPLAAPWGVVAGLASGVLQGAMNTGGPPLVAYLYSKPGEPNIAKATTQVIFVFFALMRLPIAAAHGMITTEVLWDALFAVPTVLIGISLGLRMGERIAPERFRRLVWVAFAAMGLGLILG
ncbi:MAG: putative membrane protein YfcA [Myxococcota bacterium]